MAVVSYARPHQCDIAEKENLRLEVLADKVGSDDIECGASKATSSPFFPSTESSPGPASPENKSATPTSRSDPRSLLLLLTNSLIGVEYSPKTNKRLGLKARKTLKRHGTFMDECDCIPEHESAFHTVLTDTTIEEVKAGVQSESENPSGLHEDLEDLHHWEAEFLFRAATDSHLSRRNVEPEEESTWATIQRFVSWS
jgi:hypothetical protein